MSFTMIHTLKKRVSRETYSKDYQNGQLYLGTMISRRKFTTILKKLIKKVFDDLTYYINV